MFQNTYVMSQREAEKYCLASHDCESVIISICNSFDMDAKITTTKQNKVLNVLRLSFDDIFKSELQRDPMAPHLWIDRYGRAVSPISEKDCQKIHDFIMMYHKRPFGYDLIIHCEMGISRSSAVMAAVQKALYNDDTAIFNNGKYRPNPDVYRAVLNYFMDHKAEDDMNIEMLSDLRFGIKHTPYGYNPIRDFRITEVERVATYTPFVEVCDIVPELREYYLNLTYSVFAMPLCNFPFATVTEKLNGETHFVSYMDNDTDKTNHNNTLAQKIIDAHKIRPLPTVSSISQEKVSEEGIIYTVTDYYITLGNVSSLYFFEQGFPYYFSINDRLSRVIVEIEYTFPEGYKTWCYAFLDHVPEEIDDPDEFNFTENNPFNGLLRFATKELDEFAVQPTNLVFSDCQRAIYCSNFWIDQSNKDEKLVRIIAQKLNGDKIEIVYNWEEWNETSRSMTNVRLVKFDIV